MTLVMFNETLAKEVEVKDLYLKLPFASGDTWKTECIYKDTGLCSTHAAGTKDEYALDFNWGSGNDDCDRSIVAVASGFAETYEGHNGGYGNYVLVHHIGGYVTRYAHLDSITVDDGTWIGRGQEVGKCGTTGNSSYCHLHFVLYKNDKSVKPEPMDGYNDFSVYRTPYTSSNKPRPLFMKISDESAFPTFPPITVEIAWYPYEASCVNAWYVEYDGESVCSVNPEQLCQDAYNDLLIIDSDMYSSDDWYELFFGDVDNVDESNLQCKVR